MSRDVKKYEPEDDRDSRDERDESLEEEDNRDQPLEQDLVDDVETVIYCPNCKNEVFIDAEQCGVCGHYLTTEEGELSWEPRRPMWARIVAGILLLVVLMCVGGLVVMLFRM